MGILVVAVALYVAIAAGSDLRMHRIPNFITVPAAILGLAYHALAPVLGLPSLGWMSLVGFAMGFGLLLFPWMLGGAGMGDVKLLAALGAWLGPFWLFFAFALSMVIACGIALTVLFCNVAKHGVARAGKKFSAALGTTGNAGTTGNVEKKKVRRIVPFAVPVALGTWLVLTWLVHRGSL